MLTNYVLGQAYLDRQVQKIRHCFPLSAVSSGQRGVRHCCSEYSPGRGCLQFSQRQGCLYGRELNSLQRATPDENQLTQRGYLKVFFTLFAHLSFYFLFYLYLKPSSFAIFTGNRQLILLHFPSECVPNSFLIHFKLVNIISTK